MSVEELLRATTTNRQDYETLFLQIAKAELGQRWHEVREIKQTVLIRLNDQDDERVTPEQALSKLDVEIQTWDAWILTNCLDDILTLQKERAGWLGHYFQEGAYVVSFDMGTTEEAKRTARLFLELEVVQERLDRKHDITRMVVLTQSNSRELAEVTVEELRERRIPVWVQTRGVSSLFDDEGISCRGSAYVMVVPEEHALEAQEASEAIDRLIHQLHEEAEHLSEQGETEKEIEVYDRLLKLVPADEIALFNKGVAFYETDRFAEAADCFVHAAPAANDQVALQAEEYLRELASKTPENTDILHALADLARRRGDLEQAMTYLAAILTVQPEDSFAHVNLGHLYFQESLDDGQALYHFREYLRLNPEADDRETIEEIVQELET